MLTRTEIDLAEFTALRAEILAIKQTEATVVAAALTILAAVGGFALAKKDGRIETLLVLPLVLSGLGLLQIRGADQTIRIGVYLRDHLWSRLPTPTKAEFVSWEHFISAYRLNGSRTVSAYAAIGVLPRLLIFAAPSISTLVITCGQWNSHLAPLWWSGLASVLAFGALALTLRREPRPPRRTGATS